MIATALFIYRRTLWQDSAFLDCRRYTDGVRGLKAVAIPTRSAALRPVGIKRGV